MGQSKAEIISKLSGMGVDFDEDASYNDLRSLLKEQTDAAEAEKEAGQEPVKAPAVVDLTPVKLGVKTINDHERRIQRLEEMAGVWEE